MFLTVTRADTHKLMVKSFANCKVCINRNRNLDKLLLVHRSQKIVSRRMTYAVDQSYAFMTNQLPQRQGKCLSKNTPFGRRNSVHATIGCNQPVNHISSVLVRNGRNDSIDTPANALNSSDLDQLSSSAVSDESVQMSAADDTIAVDDESIDTVANSHNNSELDQLSSHVESDENHSANDSAQMLATDDTIAVDVDPMGTLANPSDVSAVGFTSDNSHISCESMIELLSFDSDDELDHSMVASNNDSVITSILDCPNPAIANLQAPLIPKMPTILDEPILAELPNPLVPSKMKTAQAIPSLIPIRDSPLFQKVHSSTKPGRTPTQTAKHISKFLLDLDEKNYHTALPKLINIDRNVSFCFDENFGRLHYSDSE